MRRVPDMNGKAADIKDPQKLFARIGYRVYLTWRENPGVAPPLYQTWNQSELRRVHELMQAK